MVAEPRWERFDAVLVQEALGSIEALPGCLQRLLRGVDEAGLGARYREGGWTVAQIVHHLVDSHLHSYARCKFALLEETPTIKPYDENRWVETPECGAEQVGEALELLEHLHHRWVRMLAGLAMPQWERSFHHPERGETIVLYRQAGVYAWHGEHHLAQAALALGKQLPDSWP